MKDAPALHRFEQLAVFGLRGGLRLLPHAASRHLGRALGRSIHAALGSRRRLARQNIDHAFPELSPEARQALVRRAFEHLGAAVLDTLSAARFDRREICRRLTLDGWQHLDDAEADGHGVFIMSAHLGLWEIAALPIGLYRGPLHVVGRPLDNPHLDRLLARLRTRFDNRVLPRRGAARKMLRTLRDGGRVGILIDQRPGPHESDALEVPFFGRPARTTPVLARLSLRTGAPVVPIYGFAEPDGRYRVVLRPPIRPAGDPLELTGRYVAGVEKEIRRRPEQWLWLHDRWR